MKTKCLSLHFEEGTCSPYESKLMGIPYLPQGVTPPTSKTTGKELFFLAQINFSELPHLEQFPNNGILQFFINDDENFGADDYVLDSQKDFRVVYYPSISESYIPKLRDFNTDLLPGTNPKRITATLVEEDTDNIEIGSKLGGIPSFIQGDIREGKYANFQLLLQLDSSENDLEWGDWGNAKFFYEPNKGFESIIFHWECY
jgi:uncharacterized protein YwqG